MANLHEEAPAQVKYDLLSPAFFADPYPTLHRMRAEEPIHWHPVLNLWVVTRHDDILTIGRDPRFSAEHMSQLGTGVSQAMIPKLEACFRFMSHWMVFRDPPRHTLLRAIVSKAFTPKVIQGLRPTIAALVDEMLDKAEPTGRMDMIRDLAFPLPAIVIAQMLGVPRERTDDFKAWTSDVFSLFSSGVATDEAVEASHRGVLALQRYFKDLIEERRHTPAGDLLSQLIAAEEEGATLNEEELVSTCALMLIAGHETTTHFIGNAMLALLRNPGEMQKLRDDPSLIEGAVEELLRYDGVLYMLSRRATEDLELAGVKIKKDQIVAGFLHAGNRDPAVFEDPDRLDIRRQGVKSLSFGHGIHHCVGAQLARVEAQVAISKILSRLRGLALGAAQLEWIPSIAIHGLASLPVTFEPGDEAAAGQSERGGWEGPASVREPLSSRTPVSVPPPPISQRSPQR